MNISNKLLGTRLEVAYRFGALGSSAGNGGFIVETVEITTSFLELLDPFLRLYQILAELEHVSVKAYLCNHHMAIECSFAVPLGWLCNMAADLGDNWGSECDVWYEVSVHYVNCRIMS